MPADGEQPVRVLRRLSDRIAARDPHAFDELHAAYGPRLRALFVRRSGRNHVEDLVQQTWTAVWQSVSAGRYDPQRAAISTFVYAVAGNIWLQHCQKQGRPAPEPEAEPLHGSPEGALATAELLEALQACVRAPGLLSDEEREVVSAAADGESERALGTRLGLAASTINARKHSAYKKLRSCLQQKGFGPEIVEQLAGSLE